YINVPIGLFAVYFGIRNIRKWPAKKTRLDVPGALLLLASLSLISYAAVDLTTHGVLLSDKSELIAGVLLLAAFVLVETRVRSPLFPLRIMKIRVLSFSILASFMQSLGFLAVTFVIIMYLQGVRGLSPFLSSVLLLPGYLIGSVLGPYFGKLADRIGSRIPATLGIVIMMIAIVIYSTFTTKTDVLLVSVGSFFTGTGSSMFYPANNSAVMANSPKDLYGLASGFLRTMANIGMLGSFTLSVSVLSLTISRELAFRVFAGVGEIIGNISSSFMAGVRASLYISLIILAMAALFSSLRGQEVRSAVADA
ncbi:MAG TPA: MFS transporter, partial [Thermoplasmataceae archaeon]|nr:MFS transporter [Thermoplasmataceae archaeon]